MTNGWKFFILGWLMAVLFGCSAMQTQPASKIIAVSRFDQIAGKWEGLSKRVPDMHRHAWVVLLISDRGTFNFVSDRGTDLLLGTGTLHIQDGQVFATSHHGTGMFTLHDRAGKATLIVEVALRDDHHYFVEIGRAHV